MKKYFSIFGLLFAGLYALIPIFALYWDSSSSNSSGCLDLCLNFPDSLLHLTALPFWFVIEGIPGNPLGTLDSAGHWILILSISYHLVVILILYLIGLKISKHLFKEKSNV